MPLQNRLTPTGELIAHPGRGLFMGNRGILHDADRQLGVRRWQHQRWVTCLLEFKGRKRQLMAPGRYTELFFLDEAVALSAGHRACAERRRTDFLRFSHAWEAAVGKSVDVTEIDRVLHRQRVDSRTRRQVCHTRPTDELPDGVFVVLPEHESQAWLVLGEHLHPFTPAGYGSAISRPRGLEVEVLTPACTVEVLRAGYMPALHASCYGSGSHAHLRGQ